MAVDALDVFREAPSHVRVEDEPTALLVLEDGATFPGYPFGAVAALTRGRCAEVVFVTSMTGYQEICTDPSYRGQMVVMTYPLIGNYGVNLDDAESARPWLSALLVREHCEEYSNWRGAESLHQYLARHGVPGIHGLDTRALTRHLRIHGAMRGVVRAYPSDAQPDLPALVAQARASAPLGALDVVADVSRFTSYAPTPCPPDAPLVALINTGAKREIARQLTQYGMQVIVAPPTVTRADLHALKPDGVVFANGPGDPARMGALVDVARWALAERIPLLGICLGHQILGMAAGARTSRLAFGHHGANHPVRDVRTGRVTLTAQNHNFQVDAASIPPESGFFVSHINLSDGSVEGLAHTTLPACSVQFHPEAAPGPEDNLDLFASFAGVVARERRTLSAALLA